MNNLQRFAIILTAIALAPLALATFSAIYEMAIYKPVTLAVTLTVATAVMVALRKQ